jgi:Tfp pilus assembly protein PilO
VKPKLTRRSAVFAIIGGDLLLLLLGWVLLVSPQRHTAATIAHATQAAVVQISEAQRVAQQKLAPVVVPKQPEIRTAALYQLAEAMPSTTDMPDLLLEIDQVARAAGVTVLSITPGLVSSGDGFGTLPVSLSLSGDFYSLTDMLYRLRSLVSVRHGEFDASGRLFAVGSVALNGGAGSRQLTATVTVDAFVYGAVAPTASAPVLPSTDTSGTDTTTTATTTATTTPASSADAAP